MLASRDWAPHVPVVFEAWLNELCRDRVVVPWPTARSGSTRVPSTSAVLTRREDQVLGHVVADRTYSEIARALFISEKRVSSHISNLLRKTGTSNRVDLARLAMLGGARRFPEA
jgi:DNA-binding CsgD family transcriptional regulator